MGIAESLKAYLGKCPLDRAVQIEEIPEETVVRRYVGGATVRQRIFHLTDVGSFDELQTWVEAQNQRRDFPKLPDGRVTQKLECLATDQRIQIKLTYYQTGGTTR